MTTADSNLSDEAVIESAAQHFSARELDRQQLERLGHELRDRAHTAEALAERNDLDLGDVEAFLAWAGDQELIVHETFEDGERRFAASRDLIDRVRRSRGPSFQERVGELHRTISLGYGAIAVTAVLGGFLAGALGYESGLLIIVFVVIPGSSLWVLSLLGAYIYVYLVYGDT